MPGGVVGGIKNWLVGGADPSEELDKVSAQPAPTRLTPERVTATGYGASETGPNALAGTNGDQNAKAAQRIALARMQESAKGGLNATDRAALWDTQQQSAAQNRGQQEAILQGAAARGGANSGGTLAAQLAAQQGNQEAGANAGVHVAGQSAERAQQANQQAAALAGGMDQNAFQQQATVGAAQNALNAQNAAARNAASQFTAGATNQVGQFNSANDLAAQAAYADALQRKYRNDLEMAQARAGIVGQNNAADERSFGTNANLAGHIISGKARGGKIGNAAEAPVKGDSEKNDIVPAMLSPGEVVLPRSVVGDKNKMLAFLEKETGVCFDRAKAHGGSK